jgi:hypothetical protein
MKKIFTVVCLLWSLNSIGQAYPFGGAFIGFSSASTIYGGVEGGITVNRFLFGADYRYAPTYNKMQSIGLKAGVCAFLDANQNECLYLILGAAHDRWKWGKETYKEISPTAVIRWQWMNGYCEGGMQNQGVVFTVGWDFKKLNLFYK